jgi:ABC-type lipoprotein release transport system permease subunit
LPRSALGRLLGRENRVSLFALGLHDRERSAVDRALAEIERQFRRWQPSVQPVYAEVESAREASRLLTLALIAMVVIVALVGYLSIVNTCTLNVLERRREIAVIRALGTTTRQSCSPFWSRACYSARGLVLGLALGYLSLACSLRIEPRALCAQFPLPLAARAMSLAFTLGLTALATLGRPSALLTLPQP